MRRPPGLEPNFAISLMRPGGPVSATAIWLGAQASENSVEVAFAARRHAPEGRARRARFMTDRRCRRGGFPVSPARAALDPARNHRQSLASVARRHHRPPTLSIHPSKSAGGGPRFLAAPLPPPANAGRLTGIPSIHSRHPERSSIFPWLHHRASSPPKIFGR